MKHRPSLYSWLVLFLSVLASGLTLCGDTDNCTNPADAGTDIGADITDDASDAASSVTDYSQAVHWLSIPVTAKAVDIFYLYPTCWQKVNETDPNINEIDNPSMMAGSIGDFGRQCPEQGQPVLKPIIYSNSISLAKSRFPKPTDRSSDPLS